MTDGEKAGESTAPQGGGRVWALKKGANWREPGFGFEMKDHHPAGCISWHDATAFCNWLNKRAAATGSLPANYSVRLPTEAEWEYACRAGTQTRFWWGDAKEDGQGRLNWNGPGGGALVSPVDSFGARGRNRFGLADMLGNLIEWCMDGCDDIEAHEELWTRNARVRVMRGGSFYAAPPACRCASRSSRGPQISDSRHGFRIAVGPAR